MVNITIIGLVVLDRYEILEPLGQGGQAILAKALDKKTGKVVVIKLLLASPGDVGYDEAVARFKRAAQIGINHPNVVDPIDYQERDGQHFIIMPFVEGITLAGKMLKSGGKLPVKETEVILTDTAHGLGAIHDKRYVHRDIKPENIMIRPDNHACILDLGICRFTSEKTITSGQQILGSLPWMSPEQVQHPEQVDGRSDLYSLGVIGYVMLTGTPPVRGNKPDEIVTSIFTYVPPPPRQLDPAIPVHLDQACMRLLEKLPENRFQTAQEFIAALAGTTPVAAPSRFCTGCGTPTQTGARYCHNCGTALAALQNQPARCLACGRPTGQETLCTACGRPFGNSRHHLCFTTGSLAGMTFRVPEGIFSVGRNELSPKNFHISKQHFFVACTNGTVCVQDAGSINKTFVAGRFAQGPVLLLQGQEVCIAGNKATYNHN
jgi:hypothetical protein